MKTFLARLKNKAGSLYADAGARLVVFLTTEPVRARSIAVSALVAAGTLIPAFANQRVDEVVAGLALSAVTVGVGETARAKVSPVDEK